MIESREYTFFKRTVRKLLDIDLDCYKRLQVQRRIKTYLLRSGYANWPSYFRTMKNDPVELGRLKDYLTINVSAFFRNPQKFTYLQTTVLPMLLSGHSRLRVWSAGCSRGHEPYSLAMMLDEITSPHRKHSILAADIDQSALAFAQAGGPYSRGDLVNVPPPLLEKYFKNDGDRYYVNDSLRRKVTFDYHNLLEDPIESGLDLIVCRNVVIYFTTEAKERLYKRFYDALRPGGMLFVGGTEIVSKATDMGFEPLGYSLYRRKNH